MDFIRSNVVGCLIQECSSPDLDKRVIETVTVRRRGKRARLLVSSLGLLLAVSGYQGRKMEQQLTTAQEVESYPC